MATATEYRKYAQECIQSARDATSDPVREQFLDLANLWLTAAARWDTFAIHPVQPGKANGRMPPESAGTE